MEKLHTGSSGPPGFTAVSEMRSLSNLSSLYHDPENSPFPEEHLTVQLPVSICLKSLKFNRTQDFKLNTDLIGLLNRCRHYSVNCFCRAGVSASLRQVEERSQDLWLLKVSYLPRNP